MDDNKFKQVAVWPAVTVGPENIDDFNKTVSEHFGCRVKYIKEITTTPDHDKNGNDVPDTGGRIDTLFYVHEDDIPKFAIVRLAHGIRWLEDLITHMKEEENIIYPNLQEVEQLCTW